MSQAAASRRERVTVIDHPLVQHKLSLMRRRDTSTSKFRGLMREVSLLLGYEATRDLALEETEIETPLERGTVPDPRRQETVPGFDPARRQRHSRRHARSGAVGAGRPYRHLPRAAHARSRRILSEAAGRPARARRDPGRSDAGDRQFGGRGDLAPCRAAGALDQVRLPRRRARGDRRICTGSSPRSRSSPRRSTACLDDHGYILPGLGDAGDRLFGTK